MPHFTDTIEIKQNLSLIMRERGKIVARREGHNIWLDIGKQYIAELMTWLTIGPDVAERSDRIKYMGFGVGGTRQLSPAVANAPPISPPYVGTNAQTDVDPTVSVLERPVRISGSSSAYPGLAGDVWVGTIQAPVVHSIPSESTFRRLFAQTEISYGGFSSVPLSEIGLFTSAANPENYKNLMVAYDTFDTLSKTGAFDIEVAWTIRVT